MKRFALLAAALFAASTALADTDPAQPLSHGKITKIDTKWNKLTIDHGPLENLGMDAMTMVFDVADPAMIEGLTAGQEIAFVADRVKGKLNVIEIGK